MPITYQWRRDGVAIPDTPPGTSTSATYTLVSADEGTTIDCVVTASNNVGSDATETVVAPRLISNNSLIGNYEWDYAWASNDAAASPGDITAYQGGIDLVNDGNRTYYTGQYTGRLVTADIGDSADARLDQAIKPLVNGELTASNVPPPGSSETLHTRLIFRVPKNEEAVGVVRLFDATEQSTGNEYSVYLDSTSTAPTLQFHSETTGFSSNDSIVQDLDLRNHWVIIDTVISQTEHWMAINGVQYTDASVVFPGFGGTDLDITFLDNADEADDMDFLFCGFRYGSFTFADHESDYNNSGLRTPFPAIKPTISGSLTVGSQLTIDPETWEGEDPVTFGYQWTRDDVDISGETTSNYTLVSADSGSQIGCRVTGTNANSDTYTIDVRAGVPVEGDLYELEWDHAWSAKSGARVELIDGINWDYAWDFSNAPTTPGTVPALAGSRDLALDSGTYTTGESTGLLLDRAIGSSRVDSAIHPDTAQLSATNVNVPYENCHIRLIVERPTLSSAGFFWWGDFGSGKNDYIWVSYVHNADPQEAYFSVTWFQNNATSGQRFIYPDDEDWVLLDIVLEKAANGRLTLSAWGNGGNVNFPGSDGPVTNSAAWRGVQGDTLQINRNDNFDAGVLFVGVRTLVDESFEKDDHRSAYISSGLANSIDAHTWDYAWDFSTATASNDITPLAGGVDLVLDSGTYDDAVSTEGLDADVIGSSRVDAAVGLSVGVAEFTATNAGLAISSDYHFRAIFYYSEVNSVTQTLFDAGALSIRTTTNTHLLEVDVGGWTTFTSAEALSVGWHQLDVYVGQDTPNFQGRILLDGVQLAGTNTTGFSFTNLSSPWEIGHSGGSDNWYGSILFLGLRTLDHQYVPERSIEDWYGLTGRTLLRPLTPQVADSVALDPDGNSVEPLALTGDFNTATVGSLEDSATSLDASGYWNLTDSKLSGFGERHYRFVIKPTWGRFPSVGRVFLAGSTTEESYLACYNDDEGNLVVKASDTLSVSAPLTSGKWHIVDIVTENDGPERVLRVLSNGVEYSSRETGGHGSVSGYVGIGGYNSEAGFVGDVVFAGWREEESITTDAHYDLYQASGIFEDIVEEFDWNYAYDFSQAPDTPGNLPELNGGVTLTLTGSYTTGGSTFGIEDDVIGSSRVDDALTPGVSTSFDGDDRSFVLDLEQGVHIRYVGELFNTDPSGVLFQLGDTSTGSGITITRRQGGNDNFRLTVRTTSGTATDFNVSTIGTSGWSIVDFYIVPDGTNTTLQVYVDGDLSETTWSQEWLGVTQTALTIDLDGRDEALFLGVRSLSRNRLIDSYTWNHAWDWSLAPSTPGTVPAYAGGVDATIQSGTYSTGAGTGGLRAADIGQERLNAAMTPSIDNLRMQVSDASLATTEKVHVRLIVRPRNESFFFMEGSLADPYVEFDTHPTLGPQWVAREGNAVATLYDSSENGQWALVDIVFESDGAEGVITTTMVNGSQVSVTVSNTPFNGMDTNWNFFAVLGTPTFDGDVLFYGFRYGEDFTFEEHERDYLRSGLAHLWANLEWDNAWDFSEAPSVAGDIPAYAGTVDLTGSTPAYTIDQPTTPWTDEALGDAVDKAVAITGAGRNWESVNSALAHTGEYRVRVVGRMPGPGESIGVQLFEQVDDTSNTRDGARIYTNEAGTNAQQRLHAQHFDGATVALEFIDRPSQGKWSLLDFIVDDSNVQLFSNGLDSGTTANPSTAAIGDELRVDGENWEMLFLGIQKLSAPSELRPLIHERQWRAARRRNVIDRYDWTHAWDFSEQPRGGGDLPAFAGGVALSSPSGYVVGRSTEGLRTEGIGSSRIDSAVQGPASGEWSEPGDPNIVTTADGFHFRAIFRWASSGAPVLVGAASDGRFLIFPASGDRIRVRYQHTSGVVQVFPGTVFTPGEWLFLDANVRQDSTNVVVDLFINGVNEGTASGAVTYNGLTPGNVTLNDDRGEDMLFVGARYGSQISFEEHEEDYGYIS